MTTLEKTTLAELFEKYNKDLSDYSGAKIINDQGHAYLNVGNYVFPYSGAVTDEGSLRNWLIYSDSSTETLRGAMLRSKKNYEDYQDRMDAQAEDDFRNNNPEAFVAMQKNKEDALANGDANKIKAQAEADAKAKTQKLFMIASVIGLVLVGVFVYFKFIKNKIK